MSGTLGKRIFKTFFLNSLISLLVVVVFIWYISEEMEDALIARDAKDQLQFLRRDSLLAQNHLWATESFIVFFKPSDEPNIDFPAIFKGIPYDFSGEIEWNEKIYHIFIYEMEEGDYFIAKDVSDLEARESLFGIMLALLCLVVIVLNFFLAIYSNRRLVKPLNQLNYQIRQSFPDNFSSHIDTDYFDTELVEIANAFNWFTGEIYSLIHRERTMIGMASHELRTPIAIISGALQILEKRNRLTEEDRITFSRIADATEEMQENVETLLTLSRRARSSTEAKEITFDTFIEGIIDEISFVNNSDYKRIVKDWHVTNVKLKTDPILVKLMIRNIVRNSLHHTKGKVLLILKKDFLDIVDEGSGLPSDIQSWLQNDIDAPPKQEGLGLFIVSLACEQLGWRLGVATQVKSGGGIRLYYKDIGLSDSTT